MELGRVIDIDRRWGTQKWHRKEEEEPHLGNAIHLMSDLRTQIRVSVKNSVSKRDLRNEVGKRVKVSGRDRKGNRERERDKKWERKIVRDREIEEKEKNKRVCVKRKRHVEKHR